MHWKVINIITSVIFFPSVQQMTFYFGYKNVELLFAGLVINTPGGESKPVTGLIVG